MVDIQSGAIDPRILNILGAISQQHTIRISALRSDHSKFTSSGNVSNHYYGRAMDIAAIDGVPCTDVSPDGPCGTIARQLGRPAGRPGADGAHLLLRSRRSGESRTASRRPTTATTCTSGFDA